jgi:hypothetical protein
MSAGKVDVPSEFGQLADVAKQMLAQTAKPRKLLLKQLTEALKTGGVKAQIPMIQQAVSRANQATAGAMTQTAAQLASRNIAGPFAQRILAGMRMAGNETAAQIPTQMAQQLINQTIPFVSATQSLGMGGLGQAGQASLSADAFNAQQFKALMEDIKDSIQSSAMMGAACLHPETAIATPDGPVRIAELAMGDAVLSQDANGRPCIATVQELVRRFVGVDWPMLRFDAPDGLLVVSAAHPLPDGTPISSHGGTPTTSGEAGTLITMDIRVDGPTGVYCASGVWLGSTLDARHRLYREAVEVVA